VDMAHVSNLTQEDRIKGGKTSSIFKSMAGTLRRRKTCSPKCYYFEECPLMSMSMSDSEKRCHMKLFPESVRKRFQDVFLSGEEGMILDLKKAIYQYGLTQTDARGRKEYIELMLKLHKAIYGDKSQIISDKEPLQINISQLQTTQSVEKVIPDGTIRPLIEKLESKRSIAWKEAVMEECKEVANVEEDIETLFNSPMLDKILEGKC
jgi:hypothetical protein